MKHLWFVFALYLAAQACQFAKPTHSETDSVVYNAAKWPNPKAIPVCVVNRSEVGDELFNDARDYTIKEFARAGVVFTGWAQCSAADLSAPMIRIFFNRAQDWDNPNSIFAGGGWSWIGPNAAGCDGCNGGTMRIDIGRNGNYPRTGFRDFAAEQIRSTMIHEFGHAMGLFHEHERTDAPRCLEFDTRKPEGDSIVYVGKYDPNSIMNYCKSKDIVTLSAGDIAGIHFLYPSLGTPVPARSYYVRLRNSGKCMDVAGASKENLTDIRLWDCNQTGAQIWQLVNGGAGSYFLKNVNSDKCVDVDAWKTDSGADIIQFECKGTPNQRIYLQATSDGYHRIVFAHSNKCLDVDKASSETAANIHQWDCLANAAWQEVGFFPANP